LLATGIFESFFVRPNWLVFFEGCQFGKNNFCTLSEVPGISSLGWGNNLKDGAREKGGGYHGFYGALIGSLQGGWALTSFI